MKNRYGIIVALIYLVVFAGIFFTGCNDNADTQTPDAWISCDASEGTLSNDVLREYNKLFRSYSTDDTGVARATEISYFFSAYYDRPEELDLARFLKYCPLGTAVTDEDEFQEVRSAASFDLGADMLNSMPIPVLKYDQKEVDDLLMKYSGITTEDLSDGLHSLKDTIYVESEDAFYNFTSDFGPGSFIAVTGSKKGNIILLTDSRGTTLTTEIKNGYPLIQSFIEG